ncbi:hypothetical protein [Niveispirillum sp. KHB5.9]|uniref:hypothetical protein n=1 Tax=Niveispirillum sp. KHB5.9 TaxID=3400269 RepID=UPI003A8BAC25
MSSLSPAAHYGLACVADPTLMQLRVRQARDLVGRWYGLTQVTDDPPDWNRLQDAVWMAGYLPHLYCLWHQPPQFRLLCPMAAHLLALPWLSDSLGGTTSLPPGLPARDWLREQAETPGQGARVALIGEIDLVCLPLADGLMGGGVFGSRV